MYFIIFNSVFFFYLVKIDKLFIKKNADVAFFL